jgi:dephospho-CoA kinase
MKEIILIRGPLGIGKSTVAKQLAQKLSTAYISIDQVLEELGLDKGDGEGIPLCNFLAANEHVIPWIRENLAKETGTVIDGNFYHMEQVENFVLHFGDRVRIITLKAPVEVCIERDKGRSHSYGEDAARAVHSMVSRFDAGDVIQTENKIEDETISEILERLTT